MFNNYLWAFWCWIHAFTNTDQTLYFKYLEIDNTTLTNIKFFLNENGAWVPKNQVGEENNDKEDKKQVGDDEFGNVFETPPPASSPENVGTSSWRSRMDDHLAHIETNLSHFWEL
jgi:hypothetical protein